MTIWRAALLSSAVPVMIAATEPVFTYTYPAQVRAIPALRTRLDADARKLRADFDTGQAADRAEQRKGGFPFNPWSADYDWKVVTDLPRFLSLSETRWEYSGGAHGNTEFDALLWDRQTGMARDAHDLFVGKSAFDAATRAPFCQQLNAERRAKRGGESAGLPEFERCDKPFGTLILGSTDRQRFDRIGFLIAPYDAGPYAEGTYEVTLPVTAALLAAVKPEWRRYFAVAGTP